MFDKKDLARCQSLTDKLVKKVTFNGLSVADINYLKADFEWLSGLQERIVDDLKTQEQNLRKQQAIENVPLEQPKPKQMSSQEVSDINDAFNGEPAPAKKKRGRPRKKKD
jgi:hypothetical protein